ncbi:glycerophosphodiester phosphodiesterase [Aquamicrobium ahrensii]|uniref:Glycerophosphoryl diester phosphodiesterase n=1 Tax=Aquamicrobium ahrensii TaxID=469551 RepID=A0ABV2KIF7_9HYPH
MSALSWLTARPIAHRGLHDLNNRRWENTLSAFSAAVDRGYAIECDVHLTADGVPVVFHDHDLKRLTGEDGFIWQRTAAEMAALKVGGTQDHPPTLDEMLELVGGKAPLVIELKGTPGRDGGLVEAVGQRLKSYGGEAAIMSFDHWLIRDFSHHAPGVPGGLTACGRRGQDIEAHFTMLAHDISFVSYAAGDLPNRFVSFVREKLGMPVITWTIRDQPAVDLTFKYADQMTFEGFEPALATV